MIKVVVVNGWFDGDCVMMESLLVFKWVGVDGIFMYFVLIVVEKFCGDC